MTGPYQGRITAHPMPRCGGIRCRLPGTNFCGSDTLRSTLRTDPMQGGCADSDVQPGISGVRQAAVDEPSGRGIRVRRGWAAGTDVEYLVSRGLEVVGDQPAMTAPPDRLGAH